MSDVCEHFWPVGTGCKRCQRASEYADWTEELNNTQCELCGVLGAWHIVGEGDDEQHACRDCWKKEKGDE